MGGMIAFLLVIPLLTVVFFMVHAAEQGSLMGVLAALVAVLMVLAAQVILVLKDPDR